MDAVKSPVEPTCHQNNSQQSYYLQCCSTWNQVNLKAHGREVRKSIREHFEDIVRGRVRDKDVQGTVV